MKWFEFEEENPRLTDQLMRIAESPEDGAIKRGRNYRRETANLAGNRLVLPERSNLCHEITESRGEIEGLSLFFFRSEDENEERKKNTSLPEGGWFVTSTF